MFVTEVNTWELQGETSLTLLLTRVFHVDDDIYIGTWKLPYLCNSHKEQITTEKRSYRNLERTLLNFVPLYCIVTCSEILNMSYKPYLIVLFIHDFYTLFNTFFITFSYFNIKLITLM